MAAEASDKDRWTLPGPGTLARPENPPGEAQDDLAVVPSTAAAPSARRRVAVGLAKAAGSLSRLLGMGEGVAVRGRVLLAIDPRAVSAEASGRSICLVSGSNGKTTTTRMLVEALATSGPVSSNSTGANMPSGVVTALVDSTHDRVVLEVDEAYVPSVAQETSPAVVVLTNLSRDQLDRHAEVSSIARRWRTATTRLPATCVVVANADDPLTVWAASAAPRTTWVAAGASWKSDSSLCPSCGGLMTSTPDDWSCSRCSLRRPQPTWALKGRSLVDPDGRTHRLRLRLPGRANASDAVLATAAAHECGVPIGPALDALSRIRSVQGRFSVHDVAGREVELMLAKNPASWAELMDVVVERDDPVVLASNGRGADGRDLSWLWDVEFERLRGRPVAVIGDRRLDVAVRLEAAGVEPLVAADLASAVEGLPPSPRVQVAASYTALQDLRRQLERQGTRG